MDEKILNYKGVVLRRSDVRLLEEGNYLNERVIKFYFRYLSSTLRTDDILFISPSVSASLTESSDTNSIKASVEPLRLDQRKLILFPVRENDNIDNDEHASHWSLLVYSRKLHLFVHHDSLGGINHLRALKLYENVKDFVGYGGKAEKSRRLCGKNKRRRSEDIFTEAFTPTEAYGYESGLYVLVAADTVCQWLTCWSMRRHSGVWFSALEKRVDNSYVKLNMRTDVLELIGSLKEEGY